MSKKVRVVDNREVKRLVFSKPKNGNMSIFLELDDEVLVLSHITVSNIARGFHWIDGHPHLKALEMSLKQLARHEKAEVSPDYRYIETQRAEEEIRREADAWIAQSRRIV